MVSKERIRFWKSHFLFGGGLGNAPALADSIPETSQGTVLRHHSYRSSQQIAHSHQVVNRRGPGEHPGHALATSVTNFTHQTHGFHPAKDLFHSLALALADRVTRVPRGALIDGAAALGIVLRHVRGDSPPADFAHEILRVVVLVRSQRHPPHPGNLLRHGPCCPPLRPWRGPRAARVSPPSRCGSPPRGVPDSPASLLVPWLS